MSQVDSLVRKWCRAGIILTQSPTHNPCTRPTLTIYPLSGLVDTTYRPIHHNTMNNNRTIIMRQGRESKSTDRPFFASRQKSHFHNEAGPRERSDRGHFLPIGKKPLNINKLCCLQVKRPLHYEARPRERSDRGRFLPL